MCLRPWTRSEILLLLLMRPCLPLGLMLCWCFQFWPVCYLERVNDLLWDCEVRSFVSWAFSSKLPSHRGPEGGVSGDSSSSSLVTPWSVIYKSVTKTSEKWQAKRIPFPYPSIRRVLGLNSMCHKLKTLPHPVLPTHLPFAAGLLWEALGWRALAPFGESRPVYD